MAKLTSTNITLIANEDMNQATVGQNGRTPAFIDEEHLEELMNLISDYLEMKRNPPADLIGGEIC